MAEQVWPIMQLADGRHLLQHDAFSCLHYVAEPFPIDRNADGEHVGGVVDSYTGKLRVHDVRLLKGAELRGEGAECKAGLLGAIKRTWAWF